MMLAGPSFTDKLLPHADGKRHVEQPVSVNVSEFSLLSSKTTDVFSFADDHFTSGTAVFGSSLAANSSWAKLISMRHAASCLRSSTSR